MSEVLLWMILVELNVGFAFAGYILYEMQTAMAVIALNYASEPPQPTVLYETQLADEPVVIDPRETTGTFAGPQLWS